MKLNNFFKSIPHRKNSNSHCRSSMKRGPRTVLGFEPLESRELLAADGYLADCNLVYFETQVCVAVGATTDDCIVSVSCVAEEDSLDSADELFYEDMADELFASLGRAASTESCSDSLILKIVSTTALSFP